jgi:DNA processing protein
MVAVVGTRTPTPYGVEVAYGLGTDLAIAGVCVVSGMARGIDAAAHEGALAAGGSTIAILGSGVDVPYPRQNTKLYERIAKAGAIISEQPLGAPPYPMHFPMRNRLIAGISLATVIVQAKDWRSGAMITARRALDFGKELFAVPGDINTEASWGPSELLRKSYAHVCTGVGDIQEVLGPRLGWNPTGDGWLEPPGIDDDQRLVLEVLAAGPAGAQVVARHAGLDAAACARALSSLEMIGVIARAATGGYRRMR